MGVEVIPEVHLMVQIPEQEVVLGGGEWEVVGEDYMDCVGCSPREDGHPLNRETY